MDAARQLRETYYIASDDQKFDTVIKKARRKLETLMESAMPCEAHTNADTKTSNNSVSTSRVEPSAATQLAGGLMHQKRRKDRIQLVLTKLLTNLEDAESVKKANTSTESILQTEETIL